MEDKQRLFRLIRRLISEDSGKSISSAAQSSDNRGNFYGKAAGGVSSNDSMARDLLDKELLANNNLLDLDELDGSGDLLSAVRCLPRSGSHKPSCSSITTHADRDTMVLPVAGGRSIDHAVQAHTAARHWHGHG